MASKNQGSSHGGTVKDPENDGRLKENREEGRTKGTTPGSEARAREHGHEPAESSHSRSHESGGSERHGRSHDEGGSRSQSASGSGGDDLKSREYRDEQGNVHHHTKTYMEEHGKEHSGKR